MKLISRQEAIKQGLTRYFTGLPCKHGHIAEKLLSNRTCIECLLIKKKIRNERPDIKKASIKRLRDKDIKNPAARLARTRKRQASKLQRTPAWLTAEDHSLMADYYQMAKELELIFPWKQHVDHILPLQGKLVSGLHTPLNLQILSEAANLQKSNKTPA
jgi:5-methylcytosine-specific restriction endonuclease McrA